MGAGLPVVDVEDEDGDDNAEAWLDRYKLFQFSIVTKDNSPVVNFPIVKQPK